jgi:aminoglycoside 6'-N-acetyltransferase I
MAAAGSTIIRRLKAADPDLAELAAELNASDSEVSIKDFTAESLRDFLSDDQRYYLIATIDGHIAGAVHGYCHLHPTGVKYLYIDEVDTVARYRRQGVASVMLQATLDLAAEYGAEEAWVGTEHDNAAAKALYEKFHPYETTNGPIYSYKTKPNPDHSTETDPAPKPEASA